MNGVTRTGDVPVDGLRLCHEAGGAMGSLARDQFSAVMVNNAKARAESQRALRTF
jgi:hypothetical protein